MATKAKAKQKSKSTSAPAKAKSGKSTKTGGTVSKSEKTAKPSGSKEKSVPPKAKTTEAKAKPAAKTKAVSDKGKVTSVASKPVNKSAGTGKIPAKDTGVKTAVKATKPEKKPVKPPVTPPPAKKSPTTVVQKPSTTRIPHKPVMKESLGVAVHSSPKKPMLSVAPGVMVLRKSVVKARPAGEGDAANERKLSKKELGDIKTGLEERRERLLAGMRRELAVQRERSGSKAADEVDKATDAYDEDLSFEIASASDQELREIQVALEKIDKGTYGECEVCGCPISPSRLKILPFATVCVACRGQEESQRRREDAGAAFSILGGDEGEMDTGEM